MAGTHQKLLFLYSKADAVIEYSDGKIFKMLSVGFATLFQIPPFLCFVALGFEDRPHPCQTNDLPLSYVPTHF